MDHPTRSTPGDEERKKHIKEHGLECLRRLKGDQTWSDWMGTGAAMMVITEEAMNALGVSAWDKDDKRLVREFTRRWEAYELGAGDNHKPLSKQERWALREVMTNPEIGVWRGLLDGPRQRSLNHPNAVINSWKRSTSTQARGGGGSSPVAKLKDQIAEQKRKIAHLEERLAAAESGSLFDLKRDSPDNIVNTMISNISTYKAEEISKKLAVAIKAKKKAPAG